MIELQYGTPEWERQYKKAQFLRAEAEAKNIPDLYLDAAEAFEMCGCTHAADRCYKRAVEYEGSE